MKNQQREIALSRLQLCASQSAMLSWEVAGFEGEVFTKSTDANKTSVFTASIHSCHNAGRTNSIVIEPMVSMMNESFERFLFDLLFPGILRQQLTASVIYRYALPYLVFLDAICENRSPNFQELCLEADIINRIDGCVKNFTDFGLPFLERYSTVDTLAEVVLSKDPASPLLFTDWSKVVIAFMAGEIDFVKAKLRERFLQSGWTNSLLPGLNLSRGEFARRFELLHLS